MESAPISAARPDPTASAPPAPEPARGPIVLSVVGLGRTYGDTVALAGLSFELARGEILGLLGPNGAGKTTALRSIAGVLPIETGTVAVDGFDVARDELDAKRALVWVPDDPKPFETLTVREHMEWTAALYEVDGWRERTEELLRAFELTTKGDALGSELSRGMRQKLALAMAWLPRPVLALLDEPLSGLDPMGIRAAKQSLRTLAAEGTAIVLSSHQLNLVEALAARLLFLRQGQRVFEGTVDAARATLAQGAGDATLEDVFLAITGGAGEQ